MEYSIIAHILLLSQFFASVCHGSTLPQSPGSAVLSLVVADSSPATLDSNVIFNASLALGEKAKTSFLFEWIDTAKTDKDRSKNVYTNNTWCTLKRNYTRGTSVYRNGTYNMTVKVYIVEFILDNPIREHLLAKGNTTFNLTEHLNGAVELNQTLAKRPPTGIYATNSSLNVTAKVTDTFQHADWKYKLYVNGSFVRNMSDTTGKFQVNITRRGSAKIGVYSEADVYVNDSKEYYPVKHTAWFNETVIFKDVVASLTYLGVKEFVTGTAGLFPFQCIGSPPFSFNWTIQHYVNASFVTGFQANMNECKFNISNYRFTRDGSYLIDVHASNDVGIAKINFTVKAVAPPPEEDTNSPVGIAIGCTITGLVFVLLILFIYRAERSANAFTSTSSPAATETADFNFDLHMTSDYASSVFRSTMDRMSDGVVRLKDWIIEKRMNMAQKGHAYRAVQEYEEIL